MKILAIGDIVGENGLDKLKQILPNLKNQQQIDFVVVNAENVAGGMGINFNTWNELLKLPVDIFTTGNHTWAKKDIFQFINHPKLIRPANYSKGVPGKGYAITKCKNKTIAVMNLIGRTDMNIQSENPFTVAEELVNKLSKEVDIIILDFHAEATAEKIAMRHFLDGKINIIYGTHTHVQTADEQITQNGTAYITDIGMTGPINSVIGMGPAESIKRFVTSLPERYKLANGECMLNGCIFELNNETGKAEKIQRIQIK